MSNYLEFIQDLQDEGLLTREFPAETYLYNDSLIGQENLALRYKRAHYRCSVNQSRLAEWSWLIGEESGVLRPMLCATRRRFNCTSEDTHGNLESTYAKMIAIECVLCLLHLVNLAVWCRIKMPRPVKLEPSIQLLLLRLFSGLDLVGIMLLLVAHWWTTSSTVRVFSVFHAFLIALLFNAIHLIVPLCYKLIVLMNFLTSIYLVEHSHEAQRALLFTGVHRAKFVIGIAGFLCSCLCLPYLLYFGFPYCENASTAYMMTDGYVRYSFWFNHIYEVITIVIFSILAVLSIILLIVYASKRCCACCRGSTAVNQNFGTVSYVRNLNEVEDSDRCRQEIMIVDVGHPIPSELGFAFESRKLIFWQQVVFYIFPIPCLIMVFIAEKLITYDYPFVRLFIFWITQMLVYLMMSRLTILSPILSPMYRTSYWALFLELKDFAIERVRQCGRN